MRAERPARAAWISAAAVLVTSSGWSDEEPAELARTIPAEQLRICADPNNMPYSNDAEQGFENRIAELIAAELGVEVAYTWWARRRGFIRNTLNADECDLVLGVPAGDEMVETTRPYYRSTYVFVQPAGFEPPLESMLDPRLESLSIGVHLTGDDGANPPPAHALGRLGIVDNVSGYLIYGDYREQNPAARPIEAVARGEVDVAAVWGPIGGYFAGRSAIALAAIPITDTQRFVGLPFEFSIAMGVRKGETAFRDRVQAVLDRRRDDIDEVLREHGVPLLDEPEPREAALQRDESAHLQESVPPGGTGALENAERGSER